LIRFKERIPVIEWNLKTLYLTVPVVDRNTEWLWLDVEFE